MASGVKSERSYRKSLSEPLSDLLADPFSELTRARQSGLLIAATVCLLVSTGIATIDEIGTEGIKLSFAAPRVVGWISAVVTFYFLTTYCLGVFADMMVARTKRWSPLASIAEVEAMMDLERDLRHQALADLSTSVRELGSVRETAMAEIDAVWNSSLGRIDEVRAALKALPPAASASKEENQRRVSLRKELSDLNEAVRAEMDRAGDALIQANSKKFDEANEHLAIDRIVTTWEDRTDLMRTLKASSLIARLRLGIEIVLPTTYAVTALGWMLYQALTGPTSPPSAIPSLKPPPIP